MMIDTHCHLLKQYYENIDEVIKKMENNIMIVSGTNKEDNKEVINLCSKYKNIYGTIGIHPTEISLINEDDFVWLENNINNSKIVGIGEIGLDYYWNKENKEQQKQVFIRQLELAKKYNKSVVIHSREALNDTYQILKKYGQDLKIDIHCFTGSMEMANEFIKLGCKLGIGGVLTFKNNVKLVETIKQISLDSILLETDSPFLSPEPYRGKTNEPYNILFVAKKIAEIKSQSLDKVLKVTTENAISQFDLPWEM